MQIRRLCRQLPKGLLHADYWCHLGVTSKHSEERSSSFRGTRVSLLTKHRFSIKYDQSWCHLQLDIRKAGLFVTMQPVQVSPHSAGPVLSATRKKINPKRMIVGKRSEIGNAAWRKWLLLLWKKESCHERRQETKQKSYKTETQFSLRACVYQKRRGS